MNFNLTCTVAYHEWTQVRVCDELQSSFLYLADKSLVIPVMFGCDVDSCYQLGHSVLSQGPYKLYETRIYSVAINNAQFTLAYFSSDKYELYVSFLHPRQKFNGFLCRQGDIYLTDYLTERLDR